MHAYLHIQIMFSSSNIMDLSLFYTTKSDFLQVDIHKLLDNPAGKNWQLKAKLPLVDHWQQLNETSVWGLEY